MRNLTLAAVVALLACSLPARAQVAIGRYGRFVPQAAGTRAKPGYVNLWQSVSDGFWYSTDSSNVTTALTTSGIVSVTADSPLSGAGTSGSHLTCSTCMTLNGLPTDNTYAFGDATHRLASLGVIGLLSGASGMTLTSAATSGAAFTIETSSTATNGLVISSGGVPHLTIDRAGGNIQFGVDGAGLLTPGGGVAVGVINGFGVELLNARPKEASIYSMGAPSLPWLYGIFGAAVGSQPSCDSTTRGGTMTVFGGAGVADLFQVCMKNVAGSYSWQTVWTGL
jgi:hypothetical protein